MARGPKAKFPFLVWGIFSVAVGAICAGIYLEKQHPLLDPALGIADQNAAKLMALRKQVDHPVSAKQQEVADSLGRKEAPDFSLMDTEGTFHSLSELSNGKPLLIFFIEKECPCCLGAKYYVDKMADAYAGSLNTIGIINADGETAKKWVRATRPKFILLQDPGQQVISAYKAERGVYTTLIAPGGTIDKAYPGYGKPMLKDLSERIAALAKVPTVVMNHPAAPDGLTSGCIFPEPPQKK